MTTATDILKIATGEVGYVESPPNSNCSKYGQWYGMNYVPWCAIFVSYCFDKAGLPLPIRTSKGFAYCPDGVTWFRQRGLWFSQPQPGDVVFFCWRGDGIADHVGIVESVKPDGSIVSIEGNTAIGNDGNGGQVMRRVRSRSICLGFGRPAYKTQSYQTESRRPNTTPVTPPPKRDDNKAPDYHTQLIDRLIGNQKD